MENLEVGANVGEVATPQTEVTQPTEVDTTEVIETETPEGAENVEITEPQGEETEITENTVQTPEQNAAFAKMRRDYEQRIKDAETQARNNMIAQFGWVDRFGEPIQTVEHYQQAIREQQILEQAEQEGKDPELLLKMNAMERELQEYKQNSTNAELEHKLSSDADRGELFNSYKDEVKQFAKEVNTDLETAFALYLYNNLGKIFKENSQKIQNTTVENMKNKGGSPGSLHTATEQKSLNAWDMSDAEFKEMQKKALSGGLLKY